jgi:hypothetical protein
MLLIYSDTTNARLQYICDFVFTEQLGLPFTITIDSVYFNQFDGKKFNYSHQPLHPTAFQLKPVELLFQDGIEAQPIECFDNGGYKAFFASQHLLFPSIY